jgi:2-methylcitrate dehydratase PrpD
MARIESTGPGLARDLARFVVSTKAEDIPTLPMDHARMVIASTIASAAMGSNIESSRIIREIAFEHGGRPDATVWFSGAPRLPVADAARVNAVMSDAAASDDSDMRNIAHFGTIITSTGLAMAERTGRTGRDVLRAMVLGYEIGGRIDEALSPGRSLRGIHSSVSTIFSAAVATGCVMGLDEDAMTNAIALAATSIGGLQVAANTSVCREYHAGLSAMLGTQATLAAAKGLVAEEHVLEAPHGFFHAYGGDHLDDVKKSLGGEWDIVTDMAIKLVPGAHPYHAAAEAAANAARAGSVRPDEVETIMVSAYKYKTLPGPRHPTDLISLAHSLAYFVSAGVADRRYGWEHVTDEKLHDPTIRVLLDKVVMDPAPLPYPDRFHPRHGATVTITMKDGRRFSNHVSLPRGSGKIGIDWADVDGKFNKLAPMSGMSTQNIGHSLDLVHRFDTVNDVSTLTGLLVRG